MRICGFEPRLADLIASKIAFWDLFCEPLGSRQVRTLRGIVNALVFACEHVPGVALRSPGPRSAKTCFLLVYKK
jgi:hypothetical protein